MAGVLRCGAPLCYGTCSAVRDNGKGGGANDNSIKANPPHELAPSYHHQWPYFAHIGHGNISTIKEFRQHFNENNDWWCFYLPRKKEENGPTTLKLKFDEKLKNYIDSSFELYHQEAKVMIAKVLQKITDNIKNLGTVDEIEFVKYTKTWIFPIEKQLLLEFRALCKARNIDWQAALRYELVEMAKDYYKDETLKVSSPLPPIPEIR